MKRRKKVLLISLSLTLISVTLLFGGCDHYGFYYVSNWINTATYKLGFQTGDYVVNWAVGTDAGTCILEFFDNLTQNVWFWITSIFR